MYLYVFTSTNQIELTILQESSRPPWTIISFLGPFGNIICITNLAFTITVIQPQSIVTTVSICLLFKRPNITKHITRTLQVPWDYHFIPRSYGTINLNIDLNLTFSIIQPQLSQIYLYVFPPKDQIELTLLQAPYRSPGTIISFLVAMSLLILLPI